MQKIFRLWLIFILILAVIASFIVGIESAFFGLMLLPLIAIVTIIIILGYFRK